MSTDFKMGFYWYRHLYGWLIIGTSRRYLINHRDHGNVHNESSFKLTMADNDGG